MAVASAPEKDHGHFDVPATKKGQPMCRPFSFMSRVQLNSPHNSALGVSVNSQCAEEVLDAGVLPTHFALGYRAHVHETYWLFALGQLEQLAHSR